MSDGVGTSGARLRTSGRSGAGLAAAFATALIAAVAALAAAPAAAQELSVELKGGAAVGSYAETQAGLDFLPRSSFGALLDVGLSELLAAYVGINRSSFGCEEGFCASREQTFASQGLVLGVRVTPGFAWTRAGLAVQWLRASSDALTETTGPGVGFDLAAGADVPVGRGFRLRPGVTYMRHGAEGGAVAVLALELGVVMRLGEL